MTTKMNIKKKAKVVLLGSNNVGKTSITHVFTSNEYVDNLESTIGASFCSKYMVLNNNTYKLEIWDTAGQERYASLAPMYYRNCDVAIIVYDKSNMQTFIKAKYWINLLTEQLKNKPYIVLVANKIDLILDPDYTEEVLYCKNENINFFAVSAKNNINVHEIFYDITKKLDEKYGTINDKINIDDYVVTNDTIIELDAKIQPTQSSCFSSLYNGIYNYIYTSK